MSRLIHALVSTISLQAAGFVSGIMIARLLGPAYRGELSQIIAWFSFLAPLCLLGLNDAVVYYRSGGRDADRTFSAALVGSLVTMAIGFAACLAALLLRLTSLSPSAVLGAWVFLLFVPGYHLTNVFSSYFQASANTWLWTVQRVAFGPLYILFIAAAALLGHASVFGIAAANSGAVCLQALTGAVFFVISGGRFVWPRWRDVGELFHFGAPLTLQKLSVVVRDNLDRMVLPFFISASALGNYVVAATAAYLVFVVAASIDLVSFPAIVQAPEGRARRETAESFLSGTIVLSALGAVVLALVAPLLVIVLFGRPFAGAIPFVPLFIGAGALQGVRMVFGGVFKAYARSGTLGWIEGINSAIMVAILFAGGRALGAWAGVWAHFASAAISCLIAAVLAVRTLGLSPLRMIVPDPEHVTTLLRAGRFLLTRRAKSA